MSRNQRPWTGLEILNLKRWRSEGVPNKTIAKRLGRTKFSVNMKCCHIRDIVQPKTDGIKAKIRKLHRKGVCYNYMALKLGKHKNTIRVHCMEMGLKANKPKRWGQKHKGAKRHRCMGCRCLCPIAPCINWTKLTGWSSNIVHAYGSTQTLVLCPKCTKVSPDLKDKVDEMHDLQT